MSDLPEGVKEENETPPASPTVQEITDKEFPPAKAELAPEAPKEESKPEDDSSIGAQARIKELNAKANAEKAEKLVAQAKAESLEKKLAELTGLMDNQPFNPEPLAPIVQQGEEIDADELNRRVAERDAKLLQQADAVGQFRAKQVKAIENINREALEAIAKHKQLDSESELFDPELSETVTEAVEAYVRVNPTGSVKSYVDKLMKPYTSAVAKEVAKQSETLVKQASETALRPSNVKPVEKKFEDLSIKEMEAKLGFSY